MLPFSRIVAFILLTAVHFPFTISAQITQGGIPYSQSHAAQLPQYGTVRMPAIDLAELQAQDAINDQDKSIPYRFGQNHQTALDIDGSGTWHYLKDGTQVWRIGIECPGALSINFTFDEFEIPNGARIHVLNAHGEQLGGFTNANDHGEHVLGVQAMRGDRILVEYSVPEGFDRGRLRIGQVTHGYRDVFKYARGLGDSGSCNNNVICPAYDPWGDQIRSVAIITVNGNGLCTGTLINNCANDATPYFLTARHCLPSGGNVSTWVFRFNWESPSCNMDQNGPTNQTVSGATLLAQNSGTDMALLLLNAAPPASYDVYYSGWDKSGSTGTSSVAIHHPSGDVKKISFDDDAPGQAIYGGASCWRILDWESGTTEPGSSGSGLWDQNKRLIGQLYGGQASCSFNVNDYYGRFDLSYSVIQQWMGSCGNTLDGYDPNTPTLALDAQLQQLAGIPGSTCGSTISPVATIRNAGTTTLTSFTLAWSNTGGSSGSQNWTGTLTSGNSIDIMLGSIPLLVGSNTIIATVSAPNGGVDYDPSNNTSSGTVIYGNNTVTLDIVLDRYGEETTWEILENGNVLASGGPWTQFGSNGEYPQPPVTVCLPDGCYDLVVYDGWGDGMCCNYGNGSFTLTDGQGTILASGGTFTYTSTHAFCVTGQVVLAAKARLEGPYVSGSQLMNDDLRAAGLLPTSEPYTGSGFTHVGGGGETVQAGTFVVTGSNAIVDWVLLELRSGAPAYDVVATRSALIQRDGDIVDMDGASAVTFPVAPGNYHVAIRHRNHLGVMTASAISLTQTATPVDLSSGSVATFGTGARKNIGGIHVMWAGNARPDTVLRYAGANNDRDLILLQIGGTAPTNTVNGYHAADVNLDGFVRYTGSNNDRDPVLQNIGGTVPTASRAEQLP